MKVVILGLSITSSWGNGHATTYRGLVRSLSRMGHEVLFLERDVEWYADNRDMPRPPFGRTELYRSLDELRRRFTRAVAEADFVLVGSYVPQGVEVGRWITQIAGGVRGFYDIDTPVTLAKLERGEHEYISPDLIPRYDLYLSFTGGPTLRFIEQRYRSPAALPLYCSVDPQLYHPSHLEPRWDLSYMGTYSADRQPPLERLMLEPARQWPQGRFAVAGPQYPPEVGWPANVHRIEHLPPAQHGAFYNRSRFTLNITRADMIRRGYSPSVRLFEAAACGTPIISDWWEGLDTLLEPQREILIAHTAEDTLRHLHDTTEAQRRQIAARARQRVLREHTADHRAAELVRYVAAARSASTIAEAAG